MDTLFTEIQALPLEQKMRLVEDLWDSIAAGVERLPVPDSQLEELHQRKARFDANPDSGKSWAEVERRLRERYGRGDSTS